MYLPAPPCLSVCCYCSNNCRTAVSVLKKFDVEKFCQNLSIHSCFECNRASLHEFAFPRLFLRKSCRILRKKNCGRKGTLCLLEVLLFYVCIQDGADIAHFLRSVYSSERGVGPTQGLYLRKRAPTKIKFPNMNGTYSSSVQL
jgi:hypothetical protein